MHGNGGSMAHDARKAGILEFVTNSAHERAAHYREHAAKLRKMAEKEGARRLRNNLLRLADQYDGLADRATVKPAT
jgi:hypothetical protein